jgi:hypothetical protein
MVSVSLREGSDVQFGLDEAEVAGGIGDGVAGGAGGRRSGARYTLTV